MAEAATARVRHPVRGYFYIAGATLCFVVSSLLARAVFTGRLLPAANASQLDALVLSQARVTVTLLVLAPVLLARRELRGLTLPRGDMIRAVITGAAGITASNYFYYVAITKTTIAVAITIQYLSPMMVLTYMVSTGKQRPTLTRVGAVLLAFVGCALAIGLKTTGLDANPIGVLAALGAAAAFSFYNVMGSALLERQERWTVFLYAMIGASLVWTVVNPPWRVVAAHYNAQQWGFIVSFALLSMLLGYSLYFSGLQYLDATRAIVTSCLEPIFAIFAAAITLGEGITVLQSVGVAIVIAATIWVQKKD